MFGLFGLFKESPPKLRREFGNVVSGQVVAVRRGECREDKYGGFDFEIISIDREQDMARVECVQFPGETSYKSVQPGQKVRVALQALSHDEFGVEMRVREMRVLTP